MVRILALETSGRLGSVAAAGDNKLLAELELNPNERSAASLAPAVKEVLARAGWQPNQVQVTAVALGPGSFTGLRIGVTTAKTFAYAVGSAVAAVNTLEVIARQTPAEIDCPLAVALDAGRGQVFAAVYQRDDAGEWQAIAETELVETAAWLERLTPGYAVTGPALSQLAERIPAGVLILEASLWQPTAASVASAAAARAIRGEYDDLWKLAPFYLRRSAAEEKHGKAP